MWGSIDGPLSLGVRVAGLSRPLSRRAGTWVRGLRSACRPWVACGLGSESGGLGAPQAVLGACVAALYFITHTNKQSENYTHDKRLQALSEALYKPWMQLFRRGRVRCAAAWPGTPRRRYPCTSVCSRRRGPRGRKPCLVRG